MTKQPITPPVCKQNAEIKPPKDEKTFGGNLFIRNGNALYEAIQSSTEVECGSVLCRNKPLYQKKSLPLYETYSINCINSVIHMARNPNSKSLFYRGFRQYVKLITDGLYYKKVYVLGTENLPAPNQPAVMVSNHQNCLSDPLALATLIKDRKPHFLARANVFKHPIADKFLRHLGLLPAYRLEYEGKEALQDNFKTFDKAVEAMLHGGTVILYPERGHQDKRWLGHFFLGYLKIAFHAAEMLEFKKDILVVPSCNHYSHYHHMQSDIMIQFGEPVSLAPYYDKYRENPRQTMLEINHIVRQRVSEMMLNIEDVENYEAIDFLRESNYGRRFAEQNDCQANILPQKLHADKTLAQRLLAAREKYPEKMKNLYNDVITLRDEIKDMKIRDWIFDKQPSFFRVVLNVLMLIALLPLFLVCIIPNLLMYLVPELFKAKMIKDHMFFSSFNIGVSVFITVPLFYIIPFIVLCFTTKFYIALGYLVFCPLALLFTWYYMRWFYRCRGMIRYRSQKFAPRIARLRNLREDIYSSLDRILGIESPSSSME